MTTTIPLTTIFTPPAACSSSWTYEAEFFNSIPGGLLLQNALSKSINTDCFPSGFNYAGRAPDIIDIFSPGACPDGYATATESFSSGTTLAVCCQSDFVYSSTFSQKDQFNSTSVLFAGCLSTYYPDQGTTTVAARSGVDNSGLNSTAVVGPILMWGQPISIGFQQKDLALFTTTKSTPTATRFSTSTSTSAQPSNSLTQPYSSHTATSTTKKPSSSPSSVQTSGLSTGLKVGLGIAVTIASISILAAVIFFYLRKRSSAKLFSHVDDDVEQKRDQGWAERKELHGTMHDAAELHGSEPTPAELE